LLTNLSINSLAAAIGKLEWHALRWKIETFHKILKSGCKAGASKLRSTERLVNLISVLCTIIWRIFWMTMLPRDEAARSPKVAFTDTEIRLLHHLTKQKLGRTAPAQDLSHSITKLARLGGYLARAGDPPPGNRGRWRGLSRLNDIQPGFSIAAEVVGN
jgi:hypothetical protein